MSVNAKTAHGALLASALVLCGASGILLGSCSTGQPSAQESANQSAYETAASAEGNVLSRAASVPEPASAAVDAAGSVRIGKDQVTVLVLNGCGVEGAAAEVAEKVRGAGFENVTVDNATYFNAALTRVSYYHKENSGSGGAGRAVEGGRAGERVLLRQRSVGRMERGLRHPCFGGRSFGWRLRAAGCASMTVP